MSNKVDYLLVYTAEQLNVPVDALRQFGEAYIVAKSTDDYEAKCNQEDEYERNNGVLP